MTHVRILTVLCAVWILLFWTLVVGADQCPPRIYLLGGVPEPDAPSETIRMDSAEVTIRLDPGVYSVDAVFEIFNTGETTTQRVGFPTLISRDEQSGGMGCPTCYELHSGHHRGSLEVLVPHGPIVSLLELEVRINGRRTTLSDERDFLKSGGSSSTGQEPSHCIPERRWMVSDVTFPGYARTTIRCRYKGWYIPYSRVAFSCSTGRAWKGNIGRLLFIIDCSGVGGTKNVDIIAGCQRDSLKRFQTEHLIIVEERDFEPAGTAHFILDADGYERELGELVSCQDPNCESTIPHIPRGQPAPMWSRVVYDPQLTDPFFQSYEWSYPDYDLEGVPLDKRPEEPPRLKHTAKCLSTSSGAEHLVKFCDARLLDVNMIDLFIHHHSAGFNDSLRVQIRNGMFTCQFWTQYLGGPTEGLMWTTKSQKLTLDKKAYRKGDVIKGRIDFSCLDELVNPEYPARPPRLIMVKGVFKTIVK